MALAVIKALKVNPLRSCHCCLNAGWEKGPEKMMILLLMMMMVIVMVMVMVMMMAMLIVMVTMAGQVTPVVGLEGSQL